MMKAMKGGGKNMMKVMKKMKGMKGMSQMKGMPNLGGMNLKDMMKNMPPEFK